jgi:hypothetical protein
MWMRSLSSSRATSIVSILISTAPISRQLYHYAVSLNSVELSEAACNASAESIDLMRDLYRANPDQYHADLAERLSDYAVISTARHVKLLHVMQMPGPSSSHVISVVPTPITIVKI